MVFTGFVPTSRYTDTTATQIHLCPHPYRVRPQVHGFSHGLTKCPPDTLLHQCKHWRRPFESFLILCQIIKATQLGGFYYLAEDEGFEPPQTESESGVLPLHKSSMRNSYIICNVPKKSSPFFKFQQILFSVPLRSGNRSTQEYSSPACPDADSSGNRPHLPAS